MSKFKIDENRKKRIQDGISAALESARDWEDSNEHLPAECVRDIILEIPGVISATGPDDMSRSIRGFETNGWQWDWWLYRKFVVHGCGWSGGLSMEHEE